MTLFKRDWSAAEADEWTAHDAWAGLFSMFSYVLVAIGVAGALLLQVWGFAALAAGIVCVVLMVKIIDPKLRAVSRDFEERQAEYVERLERATRWEARDGR